MKSGLRSMSAGLKFGPSMVSLSVLIWAGQALADTTISTATTTPVATATAASGQPDNLIIDANGSVKTTSGAGVTLNSNNTVSNAGTIANPAGSDTTGILVTGGVTGKVTNTGTIDLSDGVNPSDSDNDGDLDGPFSTNTNRVGIRVTGPAPFTGAITNSGTITVQTNNGAAISVDTNLVGSVVNNGTLTTYGTKSYGIHTTGTVSENISVNGTVQASGDGAQGVAVDGDVAGAVLVQGAITASGYRYPTRPDLAEVIKRLDADDLLQGGPGLSITGNVAKGLLLDAPPTLDLTDANKDGVLDNPDSDGDGVADASEGTGSISSYGAAPAVRIGAVGKTVSLGNVGTGENAYGVVNRGTITGQGVYDGISATGLQLGVTGGGAVTVGGGVRNYGTINGNAFAADATGLLLNSGASAPVIHNDGVISAVLSSDAAGAAGRAIVINAGANAPVLQNSGAIAVRVTGQKADAVAILDRSGTLTQIENVRNISALRSVTDSTVAVTGRDIAIDVTANTSGVHLLQADISAGTALPAINGALLFGSGADRLDIQAGKVTGDISLGAGANILNISGGAVVAGKLTATGGTVGLSVGAGTLQVNGTDTVKLTSLNLGTGSSLIVTADPATALATKFDVAGTATIATGAKIGLRLTSLSSAPQTLTIIRADKLTVGTIDTSLLGSVPYLYNAGVTADAAAGVVKVTFGRKTAAELQLSRPVTAAYDSLLSAVDKDAGLRSVALAQTNRSGLSDFLTELLPNYNGGVFESVVASTRAFARPIDDRQDPKGGGFWAQEINTGLFAEATGDNQSYRALGFGLVGGYELARRSFGIVGLTFGAASTTVDPKGAAAEQNLTANVLDGGVYWRLTKGGFNVNARAAGNYLMVGSDRAVSGVDQSGAPVSRTAKANWTGFGYNARVMASYELRAGRYYARPQVSLDYVSLREDGYSEKNGGDGMNLAVEERNSSTASVFGGVAVGAIYGAETTPWGPEVLVGYRSVMNENLDPTKARFLSGGNGFVLEANQMGGSGTLARLSLRGENGSGGFAAEVGAEQRDALDIYDLRLTAHFTF